MNKLSRINSSKVDVSYSDIANKYYNSDKATVSNFVAEVANDYAANNNNPQLKLFARFVAFLGAWTQQSYEAWEKAGAPDREF